MNKMERIKLGRGPATVMGLAGMHCVRRCMCVFMLKSCDLAGIWWQMCAGIENACVHVKIMKLTGIWWYILCWNWECMYVFMLKPCNSAGIWWYTMCWHWECMCVFMLKPCNPVGIWWYIICRNWKCMCILQRISNPLLKLSWLQRINIRCRIVCPAAKMGFAAEVVLSVANL